jgi:uncharacterized membrane protein
VSDINTSIDTWDGFQHRIFNLADSASNLTKREMSIDENSLQINNTISTESKTVNYMFTWLNFSVSQNGELRFGDVFAVADFFGQLYGDSSIQVNYPAAYSVKSAAPSPSEQNAEDQTLRWFRTQDFVYTTPSIVLISSENAGANVNFWQEYVIAIGGTAAIAVSLFAGFYMLQKRKRTAQTQTSLAAALPVENDEEKIINLIRASRGNMRQSDITEQCRFSKAKTSQLLTALEKKGIITRYKKGRDKIVNLTEKRVKSE